MSIQHFYIGAVAQQGGTGGGGGTPVPTGGPEPQPGFDTTNESTAVVLSVLANDNHSDGDTMIVTNATVDPAQGSVVVNPNNTVTFTPVANFIGTAVVTYTARDTQGREANGLHTVTVNAVDPVANPDTSSTPEQTAVTVNVIANDTHALGDDLTVTAVGVSATQGTVVNNNNGTITFTPADGFTGSASVSYTVEDENGDTASSTVAVSVTPIYPVASNDTVTVAENSSVSIDVLANDTHALSDFLTITSASVPPAQGSVAVVANEIDYTPAANFNGTATISYTVEDETGDQDTATVTVTVTPDFAPVANPDSATTPEGQTVDVDVLANDTHGDNDALTLVSASVSPAEGTVSIVANMVRYTPAAGFDGNATISYTVEDTNTDQAVGTLTVTVTADAAPVVVNDTASTNEDVSVLVDVLANDSHAQDALTVATVNLISGSGAVSIESNQLRFTPALHWNGTAVINYEAEDSNSDRTAGTLTITVNPVNDDPTAVSDSGTMPEGTTQSFNVVSNDTDPDLDSLTIVSVNVAPAQGVANIVSNQIEFTPTLGFTGLASISYTVEDPSGGQASSTLSVNVTAVVPVGVDDTASTTEGVAVTVDVLANDTHPQNDNLIVLNPSVAPAEGTVAVVGNQIEYTPAGGFSGDATITYTLEDETGDQDTATLVVTVGPSFDPFDEPPTPPGPYMSRYINGSTSGSAKTNCNLWSNKQGYSGSGDAVEWRSTNNSRDLVELLNWDDTTAGSVNTFRARFYAETNPSSKLYVGFDTRFVNPSWWIYFDITNDGTAAGSRVHSTSPEILRAAAAEHPLYPGWIFVKWEVDLTSASDVDGAVKLHMTDAPVAGGGGTLDSAFHRVYIQDFTWSLA